MIGSLQLRHYLYHRQTHERAEAAALAGLPIEEARLTDIAAQRGELGGVEPLDPAAAWASLYSPPREGFAQPERRPAMAKKARPNDGPTNISAAKEIIRDVVPAIVNKMKERKAINADIAELRERVNAAGVPKKALDHAIKIREMDPEDRQRFDEGYIIAREAIGVAVQRSLFEMIDTPAGGDDEAPKGNGALDKARSHLAGAAPDAVTA